jgi:hypothetical protein
MMMGDEHPDQIARTHARALELRDDPPPCVEEEQVAVDPNRHGRTGSIHPGRRASAAEQDELDVA